MMVISVGAVIIGLVAVAILIALSGGFGGDDAAAVTTPDQPPPAEELRVGRSLGDPNAPVLIEAYEDPQCPACGLFTRNIEPLLVAGPVTDGTVLFTYKDYAFLGPESLDAAVAMRAAEALDGKFWDMHQIIFENQDRENQGAFSEERLAEMAVAIGLEREAFIAELANPEHPEAVQAERAEGEAAGVNSTPSLIVNGELIRGVPQWEELKSAIEAAAEEAQAAA
jgi:protein-disulfide isomerase